MSKHKKEVPIPAKKPEKPMPTVTDWILALSGAVAAIGTLLAGIAAVIAAIK